MTLTQIFVFAALGLIASRLYRVINRGWSLFIASALAVFWLQPATLLRSFDFWLPFCSLSLAALVWALTLPEGYARKREDVIAGAVLAGLIVILALSRYLGSFCCLTASRPPQIEMILPVAVGLFALVWLASRGDPKAWVINLATLLVLVILVVLKTELLAGGASAIFRELGGQDPSLASALDFGWLGFSYIAFRLVHTLRDRVAGRLPAVSLRDFVTYIVFFPALAAGPIDRIERFTPQLGQVFTLDSAALLGAGRRLMTGLFMKFVLADALAVFALNTLNSQQVDSPAWMWLLVVAYAFRIFFDFAGYTQIAIGLGLLFGILLPENFDRPYTKPNLTAFWNSWHITLAHWFRSYYFNPLTRFLRGRNLPVGLVIFIGQLSTMALIGLWHGVTWNFLIWGLWHGIGLFAHNQWLAFVKAHALNFSSPQVIVYLSILFTFAYVSLGWVWFALPQPADALRVLRVLFGAS